MSMDPSFSLEPHYNTEHFPYNENQGHTTVCVGAFEVLYFQGLFFRFFRKICASFSLERLTFWKILIWQVRESFFLT